MEKDRNHNHVEEGCVRIKLVVAYVGAKYSGWQIQEKPNPPPTIQGCIEHAVSIVCGRQVRVHGAGRTDSGVHAEGQVAHMDVPEAKAGLDWRKTLNALLPRDISIMEAGAAPQGFHARFSAVKKSYSYQLWLERNFISPRLYPFAFACGPLNLDLIDQAMSILVGQKDFAALQNAGTDISSTVRTIYSLVRTPSGVLAPGENSLIITVSADGFLKQMVRNIIGLLVEVGRGKLAPERISGILSRRDRKLFPATAPAQGLTLTRIYY